MEPDNKEQYKQVLSEKLKATIATVSHYCTTEEDKKLTDIINYIITNGAPEELSALVIYAKDYSRFYETKNIITKTITSEIKARLQNESNDYKDSFLNYLKAYEIMNRYFNEVLIHKANRYYLELSMLMNLITKWKGYENVAFSASVFGGFLETEEMNKPEAEQRDIREIYREAFEHINKESLEDVSFVITNSTGYNVEAYIHGKGNLYEKIYKKSKETSLYLTKVKAYIEAIEQYKRISPYYIMPYFMTKTIEIVKNGHFIYENGENKIYLRSTLNERIAKGEKITQKDRERAVYPDYQEVETNSKSLDIAKTIISRFLQEI